MLKGKEMNQFEEKLNTNQIKIYRTDEMGEIVIRTNGKNIKISKKV